VVVLALVAALAAALQHAERIPAVPRAVAVAVAIGVFAWLIVPGFPSLAATRTAWRLSAGALLAVTWIGATWGSARSGSRTLSIALWASATGLAVFLLLAHTGRFAQLAGVLAAAAGALVLAALWRPSAAIARSAAPVAAALGLGLALTAHFYADDEALAPFVLAGIAPAFLALGRLFQLPRLSGWRAGLALIAVVLVPLGIAIAMTLSAEAPAAQDGYDYEY
jgi:hypothetical protein